MAATFYFSLSDSDLTGGADFNKQLVLATEVSNSLTVTLAGLATEVSYAFTNANIPSVGGFSTGAFSVEVNVTSSNSNLTLAIALARVDSTGAQQAVTAYTAAQSLGTTGVKTFTFTNPALGTWVAGDRLRVQYQFVNSAMNNQSTIIQTGTTSTEVITPFYQEQTNLYWVGGTGSWDSTNALNWAGSSGGTGGLSIPTINTNVFFDANSDAGAPFTVTGSGTLAICNAFTASGLDQAMTLAGTVRSYGNWSSPATNFDATGTITFSAIASATVTVTTNGKTLSCAVIFNSATNGTVQLVGALTVTGTATLSAAGLNLNGNILSCSAFLSSNSNTRTISFGTSQITVTGNNTTVVDFSTNTGLNLSGTTKIVSTYSGSTGTRTFALSTSIPAFVASSAQATGGHVSFGTAGTDRVAVTATFIAINTTGFTGTLANTTRYVENFFTIGSGTTVEGGTAVTSLSTATVTTNNKTLDFPITIVGGGSTVTLADNLTMGGTRTCTLAQGTLNLNNKVLRCGTFESSNANIRAITFGTTGQITLDGSAATIWNTSTTTNFSYTGTFKVVSTYAGSLGSRIFNIGSWSSPTVDVKAGAVTSGFSIGTAGTDSVSISGTINTLDLTGFNGTFANNSRTLKGDLIIGTGTTIGSGTLVTTLDGVATTQTITSNGKTLDFPITVTANGPTVVLNGALTLGATRTFTLTGGTLSLGANTLSTGIFTSSGAITRSITRTTGNLTVTGSGTTILTLIGSNATYGSGFAVTANYSGATGTRTFNSLATAVPISITAGTDSVVFTANNSIGALDFTGFSGTWNTIVVPLTVNGNLTTSATMTTGTGAADLTIATTSTLTSNGITWNFPLNINAPAATVTLGGALTVTSTRTTTLTAGTLALGANTLSTGIFTSSGTSTRAVTRTSGNLTVTGSGTTILTLTGTGATYGSGFAVTADYSGATGTRTFDFTNNATTIPISVTAGSDTLNFGSGTTGSFGSLTFTGFSGTWDTTLTGAVNGSITLSTTMTVTGGNPISMLGTGTITSNGRTFDCSFTINAPAATVTLADAFTVGATRTFTLTAGTFNANNQSVSTGLFVSNNSNTRTLTMGSGTWTLSGTGTVWDTSTTTGLTFNRNTANITLSNTSATARTFAGGGLTYNNLTIGGATGTSVTTITGSNTFATIASTKTVAYTIRLTSGTTTTVADWTAQGSAGALLTLDASTAGSAATLTKTGGGTINLDYISVKDSTATPSSTWFAGSFSTDAGNNTGWAFAPPSVTNSGFFFMLGC